jgi:acyl-coenzyme A thioesterase PaaI-like protein
MPESRETRFRRFYFNFFPAYRRTGARITYIQSDYHEIHIKLGLNWKTRNYVGTIFGGSMFAAADPIYMVMLINILGTDYIIWDKSGEIRFVRPGTGTLTARFKLEKQQIEQIRQEVDDKKEGVFDFGVDFVNKEGKVTSRVTKKIYVADKNFYKQKRQKR